MDEDESYKAFGMSEDYDHIEFIDGGEAEAALTRTLRTSLFKAVDDNDEMLLLATMKQITELKYKVCDKTFRQAETDLTVLAHAINSDRNNLVNVIMETEKEDVILEKYNYDKLQLHSNQEYSQWADQLYLTCVHLLAAKGKNETIRSFLSLVSTRTDEDNKKLRTFLSYVTYQDIGRQHAVGVSTKRLTSCLHIAAAAENLELMDIFLKQGVDPDIMRGNNFCHDSPIALTVENDNIRAFRRLADVSKTFKGPSRSEFIKRFLQIASEAGSLKIVKELLKLAENEQFIHNADFQSTIDTSSFEAIRNGFKDISDLLMQNVDRNKLAKGLLEAVRRGNKEIVEDLLAKGAPVMDTSLNWEASPLAVCVKQEKTEILPLLMQKADKFPEQFWKGVANARDEFSRQAIEHYRRNRQNDKDRLTFTNNTTTPMHIAASLDKIDTLIAFASLGARWDLVDENGNLIMHTAAQSGATIVLAEALEYFDPNVLNINKDTILLLACKYSRPKIIRLIVSSDKDVDWKAKNAEGDTVLHLAVKQLHATCNNRMDLNCDTLGSLPTREERIETLQLVIHHSSAVGILNEEDSAGNTALNLLVQMRREAEIALFASADPSIRNKKGYSAVDIAMDIYDEQPGLIEALLTTFQIKTAIHLAKVYRHGNQPPLHIFARKRNIEVIRLLVQHGADVLEQNEEGLTILHALAKLSVQNETNTSIYITIGKTIIDAIVDFRIRRQKKVRELVHLLSTENKIHDTISTLNNKKASSDNLTIPLLENHQDYLQNPSLDSHKDFKQNLILPSDRDDYLIANKQMNSYDIKRILFVYLTRVVKNREKQTVLNYAIHIKAKAFIEFLLDVKMNADNKESFNNSVRSHEYLDSNENVNYKKGMLEDTNYENNDENEEADEMVKTEIFLYDVLCLTPETMPTLVLSDDEWIEDALHEKYLHKALFQLNDYLKEHQQIQQQNGTIASSQIKLTQSKSLLDDDVQQWGLRDLYTALEKQKNIEVKQVENFIASDKTKTCEKKKKKRKLQEPSALEVIVNMSDEVVASDLLNIVPLTQLVESYWSIYRWIYFVVMLIHIVYMCIFSYFAIATAAYTFGEHDESNETMADELFLSTEEPYSEHKGRVKRRPGVGNSDRKSDSRANASYSNTSPKSSLCEDEEYYRDYFLLLLYPAIILIFTLYFELIRIISWYRHQRSRPSQDVNVKSKISATLAGILDWPYMAVDFMLECLTTISCLAFTVCMTVWYLRLMRCDESRNYFLSVCLIIGWLLTINYTRGFQTLHTFKNIMKSIVLSDMLRFFMVYIFVLIGFSLGFHVLLGYINGALEKQPAPPDSVFFNLRYFLSPSDIFEFEQFKELSDNSTAGGIYAKITYLIFSFLLGLILINILIAMMNDSYIKVNEMEQVIFRLGSLRQALIMFRCFPIIIYLKERLMRGNQFQITQSQLLPHRAIRLFTLRCEIPIEEDQPNLTMEERLDNIERDVKIVHDNMQVLSKQIQALDEGKEDTKALLSAIIIKLEECSSSVKALAGSKHTEDNCLLEKPRKMIKDVFVE